MLGRGGVEGLFDDDDLAVGGEGVRGAEVGLAVIEGRLDAMRQALAWLDCPAASRMALRRAWAA